MSPKEINIKLEFDKITENTLLTFLDTENVLSQNNKISPKLNRNRIEFDESSIAKTPKDANENFLVFNEYQESTNPFRSRTSHVGDKQNPASIKPKCHKKTRKKDSQSSIIQESTFDEISTEISQHFEKGIDGLNTGKNSYGSTEGQNSKARNCALSDFVDDFVKRLNADDVSIENNKLNTVRDNKLNDRITSRQFIPLSSNSNSMFHDIKTTNAHSVSDNEHIPNFTQNNESANCTEKSKFRRREYLCVKRAIYGEYIQRFENLKNLSPLKPTYSTQNTGFTKYQYQIFQQQLRIHVQFLAQNFIQACSHPELSEFASKYKEMMLELTDRAKNNATFNAWNLYEAEKLINDWEAELSEDTKENQKLWRYFKKMSTKRKLCRETVCFPDRILRLVENSCVFMYPEYLPRIPLRYQPNHRSFITPSESLLISMGLEYHTNEINSENGKSRLLPLTKACEEIAQNVIIGKTKNFILNHIKSMLRASYYNPIQYYYEHELAPPIQHNLIYFDFGKVLPPKMRQSDLPPIWRESSDGFEQTLSELTYHISLYNKYVFPNESAKIGKCTHWPNPISENAILIGDERLFYNNHEQFFNADTPTIDDNHLKPETLSIPTESIYNGDDILELLELDAQQSSDNDRGRNYIDDIPCQHTNDSQKFEKVVGFERELKRTKTIRKKRRNILNYKKTYVSRHHRVLSQKYNRRSKILRCLKFIISCKISLQTLGKEYVSKPLIKYVFSQFKALERYTNLLKDLKMNCKNLASGSGTTMTNTKKGKSAGSATQLQVSDDDTMNLSKSKKIMRQEENFRHMLLPDSVEDANRKDAVYAYNFYEKVEEALKSSDRPEEYDKFNQILKSFDPRSDKVADLYHKMENLFLPNHPELAEIFLTFLLPSEAAEVGKFFEHFMYENMSTFINKLNIYFNKQPAQIRKVYNCLSELSEEADVTIEKIKSKIVPLLKGNQFLTDWFLQLFPTEPPPERLFSATETVNLKEDQMNQTGNYVETITDNLDLTAQEQPQACQLRYINGRIFYGWKTALPAKLSFMATQFAEDDNTDVDIELPSRDKCVHGIKECGEKQISIAFGGENEKGEKEDKRTSDDAASEEDLNPSEICDDIALHAHAVRLNPSYYGTNFLTTSCSSSTSNSNSQQPNRKMSQTISDEVKIGSRKIISSNNLTATSVSNLSTNSNTSSNSSNTLNNKRKSPIKKSALHNSSMSAKRPTETDFAETAHESRSSLVSSMRKRKLNHSNEDITSVKNSEINEKDNDIKKNTIIETNDGELSCQMQTNESDSTTEKIKSSPRQVIETKHNSVDLSENPWTRDEDKVILIEMKTNDKSTENLIDQLMLKLPNRERIEIADRHQFLIDFLSKLHSI